MRVKVRVEMETKRVWLSHGASEFRTACLQIKVEVAG